MSRVKRGVTSHAKHKKILKAAKGFYGPQEHDPYRKAAVDRAGTNAYIGCKLRKRNFQRPCGSSASTPPSGPRPDLRRFIDGPARRASRWTEDPVGPWRSPSPRPSGARGPGERRAESRA